MARVRGLSQPARKKQSLGGRKTRWTFAGKITEREAKTMFHTHHRADGPMGRKKSPTYVGTLERATSDQNDCLQHAATRRAAVE